VNASLPGTYGRRDQLRLDVRPFGFTLPTPLVTARGRLEQKRGWLLRLQTAEGALGWGEAAPLEPADLPAVASAIRGLGTAIAWGDLERALPGLPPTLAFSLGAALGELEAGRGGWPGPESDPWLAAPLSAWLLPAGEAMLAGLERVPAGAWTQGSAAGSLPITLKWKVAAATDALERRLLERLLARLPPHGRLRLDANGGWDRATAWAWADRLATDPRLEWLEQPLDPADQDGLEQLRSLVPVALDESLVQRPALRRQWGGWQVRRPSLEGDPRGLLHQLQQGKPRLMISTAFETGMGGRWLAHLAAWQARGPTPVAPGLAPGWLPAQGLFAAEPARVWEEASGRHDSR
jgi:O-succinylbenzoate synthase